MPVSVHGLGLVEKSICRTKTDPCLRTWAEACRKNFWLVKKKNMARRKKARPCCRTWAGPRPKNFWLVENPRRPLPYIGLGSSRFVLLCRIDQGRPEACFRTRAGSSRNIFWRVENSGVGSRLVSAHGLGLVERCFGFPKEFRGLNRGLFSAHGPGLAENQNK